MQAAESHSPAVEADAVNAALATASAGERIAWAAGRFGNGLVLSSSFGAQAAVMLHLATRIIPAIPVVLIDTGYLFPETYRFVDELKARLSLNLTVYRSPLSPGWLEARHGRLWEQGAEGLRRYNQLMKVEPMRRAMRDLGASAWLAGLRRGQSSSRTALPIVGLQPGLTKILPIIDWTDREIGRYLQDFSLPYHPLWDQGYVSIGDTHTSRPLTSELTAEQTRFFGLKRECGLHEARADDGI